MWQRARTLYRNVYLHLQGNQVTVLVTTDQGTLRQMQKTLNYVVIFSLEIRHKGVCVLINLTEYKDRL